MEPLQSRWSLRALVHHHHLDGDLPQLAGKRVLVAEDDPIARRALVGVLRGLGLDVTETTDGGRMLVALTSQYKGGRSPDQVDLIITDVNMPVVGGLELFRALRAAQWKTPVIFVTADDSLDVRESIARLGAVLVSKPIDLDVLERTVRALLAGARSVS